MAFYEVMTSKNEHRAQPASLYWVNGVETESEAIQAVYKGDNEKAARIKYLQRYAVPDYTCGFRVSE